MILNGYISTIKQIMTQQEFLRYAKEKLGLKTWAEFSDRFFAPESTLKKWLASPDDQSNYREMSPTMWAHIREVLAHEELKLKYETLKKKYQKKH